jgi:hypothetical protein
LAIATDSINSRSGPTARAGLRRPCLGSLRVQRCGIGGLYSGCLRDPSCTPVWGSDGNESLLQAVTALPSGAVEALGPVDAPSAELPRVVRRAAIAHGVHDQRQPDASPGGVRRWYAADLLGQQARAGPPR